MNLLKRISLVVFCVCLCLMVNGQNKDGIYVDRKGVIRWEKDNKAAAFFGTNYTAPFAYGYRAILKTGQSAEQAIQDDVYHFSRLGFDAFRVHLWDQEISDAAGNLLNNEHLRLFDFLIAALKKRNIKTLITPIAFWGNGYPEKDEATGSFTNRFGKQKSLTDEDAFKAQENYLKQFFKHKNPYTGLTYQQDKDILAAEVNNEPQHSGPKTMATEYVNRMVAAIKSSGWTKPIFYNISESPWYADALVKANVQGHSFQWYPTGLVAGHTLQGNYLPNVATYKIPFDTIPEFKNRAKIVYEFDAGDVMTPVMYPAMARSFRTAGFQWATQFAYDPMATAYANTEYQTHYLNLAYTPSKAISMLIASNVFHQYRRLAGTHHPNAFGPFKIDYKKGLSEMNSAVAFYYSNNTTSLPVQLKTLKHIAGVGSSPVVGYQGRGAYFLDQIEPGIWRLEVMPDAVQVKDPFEKASPSKAVTVVNWVNAAMQINLPDLGNDFKVTELNKLNSLDFAANGNQFSISPGTYLLSRKGLNSKLNAQTVYGNIRLGEFVAPKASVKNIMVKHRPFGTVTEHSAFVIDAEIVGLAKGDSVYVKLNAPGRWKNMIMDEKTPYQFVAEVPAALVKNGVLKYQIIVHQAGGEYLSFPGNVKGNPDAWDRLESPEYQTYVADKSAHLEIFNAANDGKQINIYNPDWQNNRVDYNSGENPAVLNLAMAMNKPKAGQLMGFQVFIADQMSGRMAGLDHFKTLVVKIKSNLEAAKVKIGLIDTDAQFFSAEIQTSGRLQDIEIPLSSLKPDHQLLLPRPYPGFLPLYYQGDHKSSFTLSNAEKLELTFGYATNEAPLNIAVESVYLK